MIDFDNPTIAEGFTYKPDQLKGVCTKSGGEWICTAYVEEDNRVVVCAIGYGKKMKPTLRKVMTNAIERANGEE